MKTNQCKRLLTYMEAGNVVDPLRSWTDLGIYRLSARIHDLCNQGHPIQRSWISVFNRYGEKIRVRAYFLAVQR